VVIEPAMESARSTNADVIAQLITLFATTANGARVAHAWFNQPN
jgi:hypothetical protein